MAFTPNSAIVSAVTANAAKNLGKRVDTAMDAAKSAPSPVTTTSPGQSGASGYYHTRGGSHSDDSAPKMHKGGPIKADGIYRLKAGEHVLTADEATKARKHALMITGMHSLAKAGAKKTIKG